ncbi:DUF4395 domain-containing protein [Pseudoclavibacter sp. RFBB5]|uniref:DUF4395 domain-containing protein n=1 Tax=Pseudoclavibacter sp. RFBB5 TaxID=2080574 RepID=UPI000CE87064|nr:DUF4395 domain-containing protein [Pseudoclavibacter sp. RFBB5]PPG29117.1 DUF4395 domain-containing protein [Pseudoclavibacter sp. RFBB5]
MSAQTRIDPRGPRFGAAISALLLLVTVYLGLVAPAGASFPDRVVQPGFLLLVALSALFAWGSFAGIQRHPYGRFFARFIRPRLAPPAETEDAAPPTFAQGVGFAVTLVGVVLHLLGVPLAVPVAAGAAFIAAFLNAVFGYCLGCQLYVLLLRGGIIRRRAAQG